MVTNGDGSQSLSLADAASGAAALSVTIAPGAGTQAPIFTTPTIAAPAPLLTALAGAVTGVATTPAGFGSATFGIAGTNNPADVLSAGGSITLTNSIPNNNTVLTFVVGAGTDTATTFYTINHGDGSNSLANLAATINAETTTNTNTLGSGLGAAALVAANGITVTSLTALTGENVTASANTLSNANAAIGLYNPTDGGAATTGTATVTVLDDFGGGAASETDVLNTGGSLQLTNALGTTTFTATAGQTFADLAAQIDSSGLGVNAVWNANAGGLGNGGLVLTSNVAGINTITVGANSLTDTSNGGAAIQSDGGAALDAPGTVGSLGSYGTAVLQLASPGILGSPGGNDTTGVNLTGQIEIENGAGQINTFIMGAGVDNAVTHTYYTGSNTVVSLVNKINGDAALGITAIAPGGGTGGIYLQSGVTGTTITTPGITTLANAVNFAAPTSIIGVTEVAGSDSSVTVGNVTVPGGLNTSDTLTGAISITNGAVTHSFSIGSGVASPTNTVLPAGATMAQLAAAITAVAALGLTAQANTTGITLTSSAPDGNPINVNTTSLADTTQGTYSSVTLGPFASENDTVSGSINFSVNGVPQIFTAAASSTVGSMISQINLAALGVTATWVAGANGFGSIKLTSNAEGAGGQITTPLTSVVDTTSTATLSYTASNPYDIGLSNSNGLAILYDSTTGQAQATLVANTTGTNGIATIGYTDGSGQSLSDTDLLNQADAQTALNSI